MEPLSPLTPIFLACAIVAWVLVLRRPVWPFYRPIALLLSWFVIVSLSRAAIRYWILVPARAALGPDVPYDGATGIAYSAELALRTSWSFSIAAASLVVFLRRRARWLIVPWALASAALSWAYPELRGRPQALVEASVASVCWIGSVWAIRHAYAVERIAPVASHQAMVFVLAAQLGVVAVVQWGGSPYPEWSIARWIQGTTYACLLGYQLWKCRGKR